MTASFAQGLVGVVLDGRYRLDAVLGEGGMGSVFRATQLAMDRKVAVKLLKPHLTSDDTALQRFAREARATLKVESPHAVKILDFGVTPHRDYYMVLEYLDGRTVQRELEVDGAFAPARVVHIARQALDALATAHALGVIHRDVKPDNLLLMRSGGDPDYTKILDFGVAKLMQGAAGDPATLALTAKGMVFGTPEFMSPEQACGQPLDGRSDLYSLAVAMFTMLTGMTLFEAKSPIVWLTHHARTPAPALAMVRPELAAYPELDELLQRCLAKAPDDRPDTAEALSAQLAALAPTLTRSPAAPRVSRRSTSPASGVSRVSGFVEVLRTPSALGETVASTPVRPLNAAADDADREPARGPAFASTALAVPSVAPTATRARRRLVVGGAITAAVIGSVVGLVMTRDRSGAAVSASVVSAGSPINAPPSATTTPPAPLAPGAARPSAAASTAPSTASASAEPPTPSSPAPLPVAAIATSTAPVAPVTPRPPGPGHAVEDRKIDRPAASRAIAEEHLRGAEEAFRANNQLRQLAEADLALRADPRSVRAKYLLADALIKGGDLDRGCGHLRAIKRNAQARDRARAAGCPDD